MRICFVASFSGNPDEGMKKVALHLAGEMAKRHDVLKLDLAHLFSKGFWTAARGFHPHIIHYVPGPSLASLIVAKALARYCQDAKVVISALRPSLPSLSERIVPLLRPDLVLTQSYETENRFSGLGWQTVFLPNGVDTEKFTPVSSETKRRLREKYRLQEQKFIILHVGPVKKNRNLRTLDRIRGADIQVLVIGSTSERMEQDAQKGLEQAGYLVWGNYFDHIEEIYALADCYVFPVTNRKSIESPLSVMEAMACNLPVISTKFGALTRIFEEGDGLIFAEKDEDFSSAIKEIKKGTEVKTRDKVLPYTWENVAQRLEESYALL